MSLNNNNLYDGLFNQPPKSFAEQAGIVVNHSDPMNDVYKATSTSLLGVNTGFGESKYDTGLNWFADVDPDDVEGSINENRAQNQSWGAKASAGVARATTKALTEIAKLPGVAVGLLAAPFVEDGEGYDMAFNNAWIRSLDNINETINTEALPVYVRKAVSEGNLWDNISSVDFWATDGADGLGYVAAMLVPGAMFQYAGLGTKMISLGAKGAKYAGMIEKTETAVNALNKLGVTAKNIDAGLSVMSNTIVEAGAEAKGVSDDLDNRKLEFLESYTKTPEYQDKVLQKLAELDQQRRSGQIDIDTYNQLSATIGDTVAEDAFKEQRAIAMRDTFVSNVAILIGPNALMHKAIWGKAGKTFTKVEDGIVKRINNAGQRYATAFGSEGFWEEGSQTTVQNTFTNKALRGELGKGDDFNIGELTNGYLDMISSTEGQKAVFLGGAFGGMMMSYQGRKADNQNRKQTNSVLEGIDKQLTNFNDTFENDIYEKGPNGEFIYNVDENGKQTRAINNKEVIKVAKAMNFTEQQSEALDEAIQQGDQETVDFIKKQAVFNLITPAIFNGEMGLQALEQKLNSDSKFQELIEADKNSDKKDSTKEFVKETLETAKYLQGQNEKFENFSRDIIELKSETATQKQKDDFLNKLNISYLNIKNNLRNDEKLLKDLESKRNDIFEELGIDPLYDSIAEFSTAKMKNGVISDEDLEQRAENTKKALEENPLLKITNDKYNNVRQRIEKYKKDISGVWQGKNIDEAFKDYVEKDNELGEEVSENEVAKADKVIDEINETESVAKLEEKENKITKKLKNNPVVKEKIVEKKTELIEKQQETIIEQEQEVEIEKPETVKEPKSNTVINNEEQSFEQLDDVLETDNVNESEIVASNYKELQTTKPKVISKNQKTGEKFNFINQDWLDFEHIPVNKVGKVFNFEINENPGDNEDLNKAVEISKELHDIPNLLTKYKFKSINELREFLLNYLPLNVGFVGTKVVAPIETLPNSKYAQDVFDNTSKPMRLGVINSLLQGNQINTITIKVAGQMPGILKIDTDDNGNVVENNITQLQAFDYLKLVDETGKLNKKGHQYIRENLFNVQDFGNLVNPKGDTEAKYNQKGEILSSGEFYLKIPMTNGEIFYLKLNTQRVTDLQADILFDIVKHRFRTEERKTLNKSTTLVEVSKTNPELVEKIKNTLPVEYNLIKSIKDEKDINLKDIIDLLVYDGSKNKKSQFRFDEKTGNFLFGNKTVATQGQLNNAEIGIKQFLTSQKRRAINFGNPKNVNVKSLNTHNIDYVNYLFENRIMNTNAVVGRDSEGNMKPTFGGYTNIYLDNNIVSKKGSTSKISKQQEAYMDKFIGVDAGLTEEETQDLANEFFNIATSSKKPLDSIQDRLNKYEQEAALDNLESISNFIEIARIEPTILNINKIAKELDLQLPEEESGKFFRKISLSGDVEYKNLSQWLDNASQILEEKIIIEKNKLKNIRNSEKNSVSLQEEPKLTNAFGTNPVYEHEIPGTTEYIDAQTLGKGPIEEGAKLSYEQIDKFLEDETFLKGMDIYKDENNLSDNDLTYIDFEKIIDLNYKVEEIKKICKGN